jgi:hypothetical protein
VAKANVPFVVSVNMSVALSARTMVPERPVMLRPTVNAVVTQLTATLVTFMSVIVPVPLVTVHTWTGEPG